MCFLQFLASEDTKAAKSGIRGWGGQRREGGSEGGREKGREGGRE
jgi:hypothetical protein